MTYKSLYILLPFLLLTGCGLIEYHPYDVRIDGETGINARQIAQIETDCKDKTTIRFALIGDTQRWYDETEDFVEAINRRTDVDFIIHGGDLSDFGATKEFLWQRDILSKLKRPYVALIGNHDCLGTGEETFRVLFGETNFSFIAGQVKFVCLNTNALEYDYSQPIPNFSFMEQEWSDRAAEFKQTVVCMHARPYTDVFNDNVAKVFQYYVSRFPGIEFCTAAHTHHFRDDDVFNDGIHYITSSSINRRNFLLFTITPAGYSYEQIYY